MEKQFILLPNLQNVPGKIQWIKDVRDITGMGLRQTKENFAEKVVFVKPGEKIGYYGQEYKLSREEYFEMGLDKPYILEQLVDKGFIREIGGNRIKDLVDQAMEYGKLKHAIALLKILDELGEL